VQNIASSYYVLRRCIKACKQSHLQGQLDHSVSIHCVKTESSS